MPEAGMATEDTEFRGTYEQKLDVKGRLVVPPVFRRALGENWVITQGRGTCLEIRTDQGWRAEMERMRQATQMLEEEMAELRCTCTTRI